MYYYDITLTDALILGAGGMVVLTVLLTPTEVEDILALTKRARDEAEIPTSEFLFATETGAFLDTRTIVGIVPTYFEDDGEDHSEADEEEEDFYAIQRDSENTH